MVVLGTKIIYPLTPFVHGVVYGPPLGVMRVILSTGVIGVETYGKYGGGNVEVHDPLQPGGYISCC